MADLEYIQFKQGTGKPVLFFLHSYGTNPEVYRPALQSLSREYDVYAPLTCGIQGHCAVDFDTNVSRLSDLAAKLKPEVVVGHSCGGAFGYHLAVRNAGIKNVIQLNPLVPMPMDSNRIKNTVTGFFSDLTNPTGDLPSTARAPGFVPEYLQNTMQNPVAFYQGLASANAAGSPPGSSKAKLTLIFGEQDFMFFVDEAYKQELAAKFAEFEYIGKPGYAHFWPFFNQPELVADILRTVGRPGVAAV